MTQQEHGRAGFIALLQAATPPSVVLALPARLPRPLRPNAADIAWRPPPAQEAGLAHG